MLDLEGRWADFLLPQKYEIRQILGEGGFGIVLKVFNRAMDRDEALKLVRFEHPDLPAEKLKADFLREARIMDKLGARSRFIVRVYENGPLRSTGAVQGGYFSMEFVPGRSLLEEVKERGPFELERSLHLLGQLATALEAAHTLQIGDQEGVVHRDLKLENVLLVDGLEGEEIRVLDFGLSKVWSETGSTSTRMFGAAATLGCAPPEQLRGEQLGAASDLFSLGVLAYELLTGHEPWMGRTVSERISTQETWRLMLDPGDLAPVPPSQLGIQLPPELEALILDCLRYRSEERVQSATEFKSKLRSATPTRRLSPDAVGVPPKAGVEPSAGPAQEPVSADSVLPPTEVSAPDVGEPVLSGSSSHQRREQQRSQGRSKAVIAVAGAVLLLGFFLAWPALTGSDRATDESAEPVVVDQTGGGESTDSTRSTSRFGTLRGQVTVDGVPWANLQLMLEPIGAIATTGADGRYVFEGVSPGEATVRLVSQLPEGVVMDASTTVLIDGEAVTINDFVGTTRSGNPTEGTLTDAGTDSETSPTEFEDNPVEDLPPPEPDGDSDASSSPRFTPFEVPPTLTNSAEIQSLLQAEYPPDLAAASIGGTVMLSVYIDEAGTAARVIVDTGSDHVALNEAAVRVGRAMRFSPAENRGRPVAVWVTLPITFEASPGDSLQRERARLSSLENVQLSTTTVRWPGRAGQQESGRLVSAINRGMSRRPLVVLLSDSSFPRPPSFQRHLLSLLASEGFDVLEFPVLSPPSRPEVIAHEYESVMNAVDAVVSTGNVDLKRIGLIGWGYGGLVTLWLVTHTDRFSAAVNIAGAPDLSALQDGRTGSRPLAAWSDPEVLRRYSPEEYASNLATSLLSFVPTQNPFMARQDFLAFPGVEIQAIPAGYGLESEGAATETLFKTAEWLATKWN